MSEDVQLVDLELAVLEALIRLEKERDAPPLRDAADIGRAVQGRAALAFDRATLVLRGLEAHGLCAYSDALVPGRRPDNRGVVQPERAYGWRLLEPKEARELATRERARRDSATRAAAAVESFTPSTAPRSRLSPLAERLSHAA